MAKSTLLPTVHFIPYSSIAELTIIKNTESNINHIETMQRGQASILGAQFPYWHRSIQAIQVTPKTLTIVQISKSISSLWPSPQTCINLVNRSLTLAYTGFDALLIIDAHLPLARILSKIIMYNHNGIITRDIQYNAPIAICKKIDNCPTKK